MKTNQTPTQTEEVNGHLVGLFADGSLRVKCEAPVKVGPDDYEIGYRWYKGTTRRLSSIIRESNLYKNT